MAPEISPVPAASRDPRVSWLLGYLTSGISFSILASWCYANQDLFVQLCILNDVQVPSIMLYQGVIAAGFTHYRLVVNKESHRLLGPPEYRTLLWLRSLAVTGATICFYQAMAYLPLSVGALVVQLKPLVLNVLARITLGESFNTSQIFAMIFMLFGEFLVAQPPPFFPSKGGADSPKPRALYDAGDQVITGDSWPSRMIGVVLMMCNLLMNATGMILTRKLSVALSNEMMLWSTSISQISSFLVFFASTLEPLQIPKTVAEGGYILAVAIFQIAGRLLTSSSLRKEGVLTISIAQESQVIFSIIEEYLVYGTHLNYYGTAGGVVIMISATWGLLARGETVPVKQTVEVDIEDSVPLVDRRRDAEPEVED